MSVCVMFSWWRQSVWMTVCSPGGEHFNEISESHTVLKSAGGFVHRSLCFFSELAIFFSVMLTQEKQTNAVQFYTFFNVCFTQHNLTVETTVSAGVFLKSAKKFNSAESTCRKALVAATGFSKRLLYLSFVLNKTSNFLPRDTRWQHCMKTCGENMSSLHTLTATVCLNDCLFSRQRLQNSIWLYALIFPEAPDIYSRA